MTATITEEQTDELHREAHGNLHAIGKEEEIRLGSSYRKSQEICL